jgi:hypothetical protein
MLKLKRTLETSSRLRKRSQQRNEEAEPKMTKARSSGKREDGPGCKMPHIQWNVEGRGSKLKQHM